MDKLRIISPRRSGDVFIKNLHSNSPDIVVVAPITIVDDNSKIRWQAILDFAQKSALKYLVVIDKTPNRSATEFFLQKEQFRIDYLVILQRSELDTLFDSLGEIKLDRNLWIVQLHDDDTWDGLLSLPENPEVKTVYFSNYFVAKPNGRTQKIDTFDYPNRIVFSLVPSVVWNIFSKMIENQNFHVAGSFDYTLLSLAKYTCNFVYTPGFSYYWHNDNWETRQKARIHLTRLATHDGWGDWASPEIANFNRTLDSFTALASSISYLSNNQLNAEINRLLFQFKSTLRNRIKIILEICITKAVSKLSFNFFNFDQVINAKLGYKLFLRRINKVSTITEVIREVEYLQRDFNFIELERRFEVWQLNLKKLDLHLKSELGYKS